MILGYVLEYAKTLYQWGKRNPNKIDKELLGLWVHHLGGERVLRDGDYLLIVKAVEEPEWEEI